jgi:hypothetical protein
MSVTIHEDTAGDRLPPSPQEGECPRCGSPTEPLQEYCLECGTRLPAAAGPGATLAAGWRRSDWSGREWVWPVLVALIVAVIAAAAVLAVAAARDDTAAPFIATQEPVGPPVTATTEVVPTTSVPTTAPTAPATTAPPPPPPRQGLVQWPAGQDGYTVVLASLPARGGRPAATSQAKAASDAGLREVGVLNSSAYPSLQPRYFVVFAGIHDTERAAVAALPAARRSGYDAAYVKRIAR